MDFKRKDCLRKLNKPGDFQYFMSSLEDYLFDVARLGSWEAVSKLYMLDFKYFKGQDMEAYKAGLVPKGLINGGKDTTSSGEDAKLLLSQTQLKDKVRRLRQRTKVSADKFTQIFVDSCYDTAVEDGKGFLPWVGKVYVAIRAALSEEYLDQMAGCKRGDLLTLMLELQMAVGNVEQIDSSKLYLDFMQANMRASGENSLLKYIAFLK